MVISKNALSRSTGPNKRRAAAKKKGLGPDGGRPRAESICTSASVWTVTSPHPMAEWTG